MLAIGILVGLLTLASLAALALLRGAKDLSDSEPRVRRQETPGY